MRRIGVFGGTFDPVHNEHVATARAAAEQLGLDRLYVVPTAMPPHKDGYRPTDGALRIQMLSAAFEGDSRIVVSDFEISAGGKSYTYLTTEHFAALHPDCTLYLIVGEDMFENFPKWKYPERVIALARVAAVKRKGGGASLRRAARVFRDNCWQFDVLRFTGREVSSTAIRIDAMLGQPIKEVPEAVEQIIRENNLYAGGEAERRAVSMLSEKRKRHTAGVMKLCAVLAKRLGIDVQKALLAACLHDVAKHLKAEDYPDFGGAEGVPQPVVHAFLGEHVARTRLGVTDGDVLNAIKYHTSGRPGMSDLEKIVYLADMLEQGRAFRGVRRLRALVKKDFDKAFCACIERSYRYLLKTKKPHEIYELTREAYEYYCKKRAKK